MISESVIRAFHEYEVAHLRKTGEDCLVITHTKFLDIQVRRDHQRSVMLVSVIDYLIEDRTIVRGIQFPSQVVDDQQRHSIQDLLDVKRSSISSESLKSR